MAVNLVASAADRDMTAVYLSVCLFVCLVSDPGLCCEVVVVRCVRSRALSFLSVVDSSINQSSPVQSSPVQSNQWINPVSADRSLKQSNLVHQIQSQMPRGS